MSNDDLLSQLEQRLIDSEEDKEELQKLIKEIRKLTTEYYPKPLTTQEVCEKYQVSRRTLTRWISAGKLKPVSNIGGNRFDEADIRNLRSD